MSYVETFEKNPIKTPEEFMKRTLIAHRRVENFRNHLARTALGDEKFIKGDCGLEFK